MPLLDANNALLQRIQATVEDVIASDHSTTSAAVMTDDKRHKIINRLIAYSDQIPHPASGDKTHSNTLIRWQILAYVAAIDLTIAKWFESHLDALSILHEVGYDKAMRGLWAIWAAEGHPDPIRYEQGKVSGSKAWCSGAHRVDHALMTYRDEVGHSQLLIVDMQQKGIKIDNKAWQAVGMQATDTATVQFNEVAAHQVGGANAYLERVGFWHGAAGVAACWYGATVAIAAYLTAAYQKKPNHYKAMYLGQVSTSLSITQQYFYHAADLIDSQSQLSHELVIRKLRSQAEQAARQIMEVTGQALGAAPFCRHAHFARLSADLAVFIRQSHGAFDLQKIGELSGLVASDLEDKSTAYQSTTGQVNIWQL